MKLVEGASLHPDFVNQWDRKTLCTKPSKNVESAFDRGNNRLQSKKKIDCYYVIIKSKKIISGKTDRGKYTRRMADLSTIISREG